MSGPRRGDSTATHPFRLGRQPPLDGLRAIAVLAVMAFHAEIQRLNVNGGYLGVDVFFVLSGFLITALLIEEREGTGRIRLGNFYMRRALRLLPALFLMLGACAIFAALYPHQIENHTFGRDALGALFYAANWVQVAVGHTEVRLLSHTWSLSVEEQFYLLWPIALIAMLHWHRSRRFILGVLIAAVVASFFWRWALLPTNGSAPVSPHLFVGLDTRGAGLLVGCIAGLLYSWRLLPKSERFISAMRPAAVLALAGIVFMFLGPWLSAAAIYAHPARLYLVGLPLLAVLVAVLIVAVVLAPDGAVARGMALRPVAWIGRISYGLYLWHYPIDRALRPGAHTLGLGHFELQVVRLVAAFGAATLSFYLVEQPILRLKRRYSAHTGTPPELPAVIDLTDAAADAEALPRPVPAGAEGE